MKRMRYKFIYVTLKTAVMWKSWSNVHTAIQFMLLTLPKQSMWL